MICCVFASLLLSFFIPAGMKRSINHNALAWNPHSAPPRSKPRIWLSFTYAIKGIRAALKSEANLRIHLMMTLLVVILAFALHVPIGRYPWLIIAIAMVWSAELFNTSIERACDAIDLEQNPLIGLSKDIAAGGVLVVSIAAALIGIYVFLAPESPLSSFCF